MAKRIVMTIKVCIDTADTNKYVLDIKANKDMPARHVSELLSTVSKRFEREGTIFQAMRGAESKEVNND